jgi:hypothetical protein
MALRPIGEGEAVQTSAFSTRIVRGSAVAIEGLRADADEIADMVSKTQTTIVETVLEVEKRGCPYGGKCALEQILERPESPDDNPNRAIYDCRADNKGCTARVINAGDTAWEQIRESTGRSKFWAAKELERAQASKPK